LTGSDIRVISSNHEFRQTFFHLNHLCIINCRLRLAPGEEHLFVDLLERGVFLLPSATAQLASRSKVHQSLVFRNFMVPETTVLYSPFDLLAAISRYSEAGIGEVVVKRDRKNGGIGIHRFASIEEVHNLAAFGYLEFPLVVQPFIEEFRDIRVIILGEYSEAYERINPSNFRHNLHCGGRASPCILTDEQLVFCQRVLACGSFPYAHLDLMVLPSGTIYLIEINLRGGLRGAKIKGRRYLQLTEELDRMALTKAIAHVRHHQP
jgi:glutathione synthase/RimK-type ligase-like ATP-grasp enzyme